MNHSRGDVQLLVARIGKVLNEEDGLEKLELQRELLAYALYHMQRLYILDGELASLRARLDLYHNLVIERRQL